MYTEPAVAFGLRVAAFPCRRRAIEWQVVADYARCRSQQPWWIAKTLKGR